MTPWTWCRCLHKTSRISRTLTPSSRNGNRILCSKRSAKSNLSKITVAKLPQKRRVKTARCSRSRSWKELWRRPQLSNKDCNRPCLSTESVSQWLLKVTSPLAQAASSKAQPISTTYAHGKPMVSPISESCLSERNGVSGQSTFRQCRIVTLTVQSRCHPVVQVLLQAQKYTWTTQKIKAEAQRKISWYHLRQLASWIVVKMNSLMQAGSNKHQISDSILSLLLPPTKNNQDQLRVWEKYFHLMECQLSGAARINILAIWLRKSCRASRNWVKGLLKALLTIRMTLRSPLQCTYSLATEPQPNPATYPASLNAKLSTGCPSSSKCITKEMSLEKWLPKRTTSRKSNRYMVWGINPATWTEKRTLINSVHLINTRTSDVALASTLSIPRLLPRSCLTK